MLCGFLPAPQFTVALLGPPVAYMLLRKHPLLSWQTPIVAAAITLALQDRDPHGPYTQGPIWPEIFLVWTVESLFSVPWPYIFQRISRHERGHEVRPPLIKAAKTSLGAGVLIFLTCGLIILGFAGIVYVFASPSQVDVSLLDQSLGFLMATAGMALAVNICRSPEKLGLDYQIDSLFGWILAPIALCIAPAILIDAYRRGFHCGFSPDCTNSGPPLQQFLNFVASLEALAVVIWLLRRGKRTKHRPQENEIRSGA